MLLGTAKVLNENKDSLQGEVRFLFQTGEEIAKGSDVMIKNEGCQNIWHLFFIFFQQSYL